LTSLEHQFYLCHLQCVKVLLGGSAAIRELKLALAEATVPIAVVSDNGSCFRGETYQSAFAGDDPLPRHVGTRLRSPQRNGVIERFFGTLKTGTSTAHRSTTAAP